MIAVATPVPGPGPTSAGSSTTGSGTGNADDANCLRGRRCELFETPVVHVAACENASATHSSCVRMVIHRYSSVSTSTRSVMCGRRVASA